ncbi:MAG: FAD-dependent oxidoreductase [Nitrospirae bacterium]|nr:FAD-dependent oxidoreductase [Nitrospirota bacterium]
MSKNITIHGKANDNRVPSRVLEETIQAHVEQGVRDITINADGQHGIGGRIWPRGETVRFTVKGSPGQRLGSMGMFGTEIVVHGSASDDVGWLNCGAKITVLGDVTNGAHNAAAQGVLYVQGSGGARCDTMTKHNPKQPPPESWYFREVGDTFAEFKAGGIAVVCGVNPKNPRSVLGYRPCVGMVGGVVYFRGAISGYSEADVKLLDLTDADWDWLTPKMKTYLEAIDRSGYFDELTSDRGTWKKLIPYTAAERSKKSAFKMTISDFKANFWEKEVGKDGIFAEYVNHPLTPIPYITTGIDRRYKPLWSNKKYAPPCQGNCPSGIPTQKRAALIREDRLEEALELILQYSPFPATVCGEICPNLCMEACTRGQLDKPLNIKGLGKASLNVKAPKKEPPTGKKVAVIGGGAAGLSAAWQLALKGHTVELYEEADEVGGKLGLSIPKERLPQDVLLHELKRIKDTGIHINYKAAIDSTKFNEIYSNHDIVIVAVGAHKPRKPSIPGIDSAISAYDFLRGLNTGKTYDLTGKRVLIIGAGNVAMDVAAQAWHTGAKEVTAVDVQKPAAFGKELEIAQSLGTKVVWPKFTDKYVKEENKVCFTDGSTIDTDVVIYSIGDIPVTDFLPPSVHTNKGGSIEADEVGHTSDAKVFAIGDVKQQGLATHAIGQGRLTALAVHTLLTGGAYYRPAPVLPIPYQKIKDVYYEICRDAQFSTKAEGHKCMSCAVCRDCHMCEATCYVGAISRITPEGGGYEYVSDDNICIGCGFCAGVCPCGIWEMVENK